MKMENKKSASNEVPPAESSYKCGQSSRHQDMAPIWQGNRGFTLIEIIVVVVIMGVLGIFGYRFLSTAVHTYSMMEKQKSLYDEAAMAMERISRGLRDAKSISSPTSGNTSSTLTFTKSHGCSEDSTTDGIRFQLSGTTLQRVGSSTVNLAEKVSAFTVARGTSPADEITITLTLSEATGEEITLQTYIYPKNLPYPDESAPSGRNFGGHWREHFQ